MPQSSSRFFPVSWEELHRDARALSWRLANDRRWEGIVAVVRGGLAPAQIVARELDIRLIDTVCVASYDEQVRAEPRVLKGPTVAQSTGGEGWLIIDDLVDTGRTGRIVREMLPKAHFATVYAKPAGRPIVDTYITEVSQDTWIHFPWDLAPAYAQPIVTSRRG